MKTGLLTVLLITLSSIGAEAQSLLHCDSVVKRVSFENTAGLNAKNRATLNSLLLGRCFQRDHVEVLTEVIYRQLRDWGYKQVTVYDPQKTVVLDDSVRPSPVAVTIDFRLTESNNSAR